ncbi:GNAT family N-acetyltransferase [Streptomyces decoyicus]|uniref:GNAT family N-acetyltransferase n=1 Tax=Streptomyces decoyicus TaxID=249567 RepID=UPI00386EC6EE
MSELRTERLLLRGWRESDLAPWTAMNADPEARAHFPAVLTREQSEEHGCSWVNPCTIP